MNESDENLRHFRQRAEAALDGELDAAHEFELEAEMRADVRLQRLYESLRRERDGRRAALRREIAPPELKARVMALVDPPKARDRAPASWLALAAAFVVGVIVAAGALSTFYLGGGQRQTLHGLVADYVRGEIAGRPFDIASSDRHTVRPWLAGKVTIGVEAPDLAAEGFPLAGGRVDLVDGAATPTLVYRHNEHVIAVTEMPNAIAPASAPDSLDGYRLRRWSDPARVYVAVSDLEATELQTFVEAFQAATTLHK